LNMVLVDYHSATPNVRGRFVGAAGTLHHRR
jgi:hypothetical protein